MADPDDNFIARWSRRKRGEEPPEDPATVGEVAAVPAEKEPAEPETADPAENEIVAQLPDIETLDEQADFTVFLKKGVPEELRKRALRRLWRLNPVFANLDGLNDYDEDFNTATTLLEGLKTVYQVGKGMPGPAEPQADETQTSERETSETPADGETRPAGQGGPIDEGRELGPQEVEQAATVPGADLREQAALPDGSEPTAAERRDESARVTSGRSAAARRWGRFRED